MNCAEQLVDIFGSQADVARAFRLDRAVVRRGVRTVVVAALWAGEGGPISQARISPPKDIMEATANTPGRAKSPLEPPPFVLSESVPRPQDAPTKLAQPSHPPQRP